MKKNFKKLIVLSVLTLSIISTTSFKQYKTFASENIEKHNKLNNSIQPNGFIKRIYAETSRIYFSFKDIKSAVYHEHQGFKGYIGKTHQIETSEGIVVYYGGYLYPTDYYPTPNRKKIEKDNLIDTKDIELKSSISKKHVVFYRNYKQYLAIENKVPYDDGTYFGYIKAVSAEQNSDWSWTVRYEGYAYNLPRGDVYSLTESLEK